MPLNENFRTVNVAAEESDSDSVLDWYRTLIHLRSVTPELLRGTFTEQLSDHAQIFAYERRLEKDRKVLVLVNLSETEATFERALVKNAKVIVSNYGDCAEGVLAGKLRPMEAAMTK